MLELWWQQLLFLAAVSGILVYLSELVRRAERAAQKAEDAARQANPEFAIVGQDSDTTIVRMAARWGADVLSAIASGSSGVEAVRRAVPRIGSLPRAADGFDAGSEVSTDELPANVPNPADWITCASQSVTPVPEVHRGVEELHTRSLWSASGLSGGGTFIPGVHETRSAIVHRPHATVARLPRPALSPTNE